MALQTLAAPPGDFPLLLVLPAAAAALAAAAAVSSTEQSGFSHSSIPRFHGVERLRQKVPVAEEPGQEVRPSGLCHVDDDNNDDERNDWHAHPDQHLPASHRQAENSQGDDQEAQNEVEDSKPAILGCPVPQSSGQPDG